MNVGLTLFRVKNRLLGYLLPEVIVDRARELFLTPRCYALKTWEIEKENQGTRTQLNSELSVITWGDSPKKVLVVHGWSSRATLMSGFVDDFLRAGFKVIAIDAPGHGKSGGYKTNIQTFAKAIEVAYEKLGPFEAVVGHSMGAAAAASIVPKVFKPTKLVLISAPDSLKLIMQRFAKFIGLSLVNAQRLIYSIEKEVGQPVDAYKTSENLRGFCGEGLLIHDETDADIPYQDAESIKECWPSARLIKTNGLGHRSILRQPAIWREVADFLK